MTDNIDRDSTELETIPSGPDPGEFSAIWRKFWEEKIALYEQKIAEMKAAAQLADQILNSVDTSDSSVSHVPPPRSAGPPSRK